MGGTFPPTPASSSSLRKAPTSQSSSEREDVTIPMTAVSLPVYSGRGCPLTATPPLKWTTESTRGGRGRTGCGGRCSGDHSENNSEDKSENNSVILLSIYLLLSHSLPSDVFSVSI